MFLSDQDPTPTESEAPGPAPVPAPGQAGPDRPEAPPMATQLLLGTWIPL
jgi:hypothetical protein